MLEQTPLLDFRTQSESDLAFCMFSACPEQHFHTLLKQQPDLPPDITAINHAAASIGLPTYPSFEAFRRASTQRRVSNKKYFERGVVWLCSKGILVSITKGIAVLSTSKGGVLVSIPDNKSGVLNAWHWPQARIV